MDWQVQQQQLYKERQAAKELAKQRAAEQQRLLLKAQFAEQQRIRQEAAIERECKAEAQRLLEKEQQAAIVARQREELLIENERRQAALQEAHKRMQEIRAHHPDFPYDTFAEQDFHKRWRELHPDVELIPQYRIGSFRVDFCHEPTKTVIELNGSIHRIRRVQNRDAPRHRLIGAMGWHVLPFTNDEINVCLDICIQEVFATIMAR